MTEKLNGLKPVKVFYFFEQLCRIPHGSGNTDAISNFCVEFAKERNLRYIKDSNNNVVIFKDASAGYEDHKTVINQGHLDMVCEKTAQSQHDFTKDPLDLYVEDGFVNAKDTTLGGDDGIAVAYALAILRGVKPLNSYIVFALVSTVSSRLLEFYGVAIRPYVSSVTSYLHNGSNSAILRRNPEVSFPSLDYSICCLDKSIP